LTRGNKQEIQRVARRS